jgi:hypothetical protein
MFSDAERARIGNVTKDAERPPPISVFYVKCFAVCFIPDVPARREKQKPPRHPCGQRGGSNSWSKLAVRKAAN